MKWFDITDDDMTYKFVCKPFDESNDHNTSTVSSATASHDLPALIIPSTSRFFIGLFKKIRSSGTLQRHMIIEDSDSIDSDRHLHEGQCSSRDSIRGDEDQCIQLGVQSEGDADSTTSDSHLQHVKQGQLSSMDVDSDNDAQHIQPGTTAARSHNTSTAISTTAVASAFAAEDQNMLQGEAIFICCRQDPSSGDDVQDIQLAATEAVSSATASNDRSTDIIPSTSSCFIGLFGTIQNCATLLSNRGGVESVSSDQDS